MIALAATLLMYSCVEYTSVDYTQVEQEIFDEWMATNRPELLDNYQSNGGYYIDLISAGDTSGRPLSDTICWVAYDLTGYDLHGNVSITRNDVVAWQQGSFSTATHYVPYFRYSDPDPDTEYEPLLECSQLAFSNELTIGDQKVLLYNGAEFVLYSPSSIITSEGTSGTGGYEGQFSLGTLPFVGKFKVTNVIYDPTEYEQEIVDAFATDNGGLTINPDSLDDEDDEDETEETSEDADQEVEDTNAWTNSVDSIGYVYINRTYTPNTEGESFNYNNPYVSKVPTSPYINGVAALDVKINAILEELFSEDYDPDGEEVGEDGTATVWYIGRFLDGFIFDTNIAEVKDLINNTVDSTGTAISYTADSDSSSYILSWYYTIPYMKYGQWSTIISVSDYAYGYAGTNGDTTYSSSSTSSYYDYYNYYNYYNNYYGYSSYYGNSYYDSSYYYNNSYYNDDTSTTTTTVTTEILPYTPLIFEIYIEATDDDE